MVTNEINVIAKKGQPLTTTKNGLIGEYGNIKLPKKKEQGDNGIFGQRVLTKIQKDLNLCVRFGNNLKMECNALNRNVNPNKRKRERRRKKCILFQIM